MTLFLPLPQIGMLKCIITLYEESQKAIADSPVEKRITWSYIKTTLADVLEKVKETKFVVRASHQSVQCSRGAFTTTLCAASVSLMLHLLR